MSKQIYIDENGNENLVSGTINNAEMLPYDDNTSTKEKIDEKQDKLTITTGTITAGTNVTLIRPTAIKYGKLKILSFVFKVTGSTTAIAALPTDFTAENNVDFSVVGDNGSGCRLQIVANSATILIPSAPTQNEYYAVNVCYI